MSSMTEPLMPRPASISVCSERETTSRDASSSAFGAYFFMKRSPSLLIRNAPSPRQPSVRRIPDGYSVVGWNCMNSMSFSGTPACSAIAMPSPVQAYAFVVTRYWRPAPPVASTMVFPPSVFRPPFIRSQQTTPWQRPSLTTSCHAKNSS